MARRASKQPLPKKSDKASIKMIAGSFATGPVRAVGWELRFGNAAEKHSKISGGCRTEGDRTPDLVNAIFTAGVYLACSKPPPASCLIENQQ
jgi:hypothetical protein